MQLPILTIKAVAGSLIAALGWVALAGIGGVPALAQSQPQLQSQPQPQPQPVPPPAAGRYQMPGFWDPRRRPERPDLSRVTLIRFLTEIDYPPFHYAGPDGAPACGVT